MVGIKVISSILLIVILSSCSTMEYSKKDVKEVIDREYKIFDTKTGLEVDLIGILNSEKMDKSEVIFFGEFHDDPIIHKLKNSFLDMFVERSGNRIAASMEMFERDVQPIMDQYLKGEIDEDKFLESSRPWKEDYERFYGPIVNRMKDINSTVICANIPRKYASLYARGGMKKIDSLPTEERKYISQSISIDNDRYREDFISYMLSNLGVAPGTELNPNQENTFQLFYGAQILKDETMAESIYNFLESRGERYKGFKLIHFNGDFHSRSKLGTVQKLNNRDKLGRYKPIVITPEYVERGSKIDFNKDYIDVGDFVIVLEEKPQDEMMSMGGHLFQNSVKKHNIVIEINPEEKTLYGIDSLQFKNPIVVGGLLNLPSTLLFGDMISEDGKFSHQLDSKNSKINIKPIGEDEVSKFVISYSGILGDDESIKLNLSDLYPSTKKDKGVFNFDIVVPNGYEVVNQGLEWKASERDDNRISYSVSSDKKVDGEVVITKK